MSRKKNSTRINRHRRVRSRLAGTAACPRLAVYRSLKHIKVQLIDDVAGKTLAAASDAEIKKTGKMSPQEIASSVGKLIADKAQIKSVSKVVFDRGGLAYHGRIKSLAEGARAGGLKF